MGIENLTTKGELAEFIQQQLEQPGILKQPAVTGLADALGSVKNALVTESVGQHVVFGVVDTTDTDPVSGEGFTVAINGTGDVTITFTTPFSIPPVVLATAEDAGSDSITCSNHAVDESSATVHRVQPGVASFDGLFHFLAIGPR